MSMGGRGEKHVDKKGKEREEKICRRTCYPNTFDEPQNAHSRAHIQRDIFLANYMLQMIQQKLESVDELITGAISYEVTLMKNRLIELEHETGYV